MKAAINFCLLLCLAAGSAGTAGEPAFPKFTAKPTAAKAADGKVKIEFAVDRETDVAVFVEDGAGKVVRHLVAGVLGKNPPLPLKPGLAQSIEWDGRADYGKPAGGGSFKVRVALGMSAKFDKVLISDPQNFGAQALGVGPDGTVYCLGTAGHAWGGPLLIAVSRAGAYGRTVMPFPASLKPEQVKAFGAFDLDGRATPVMYGYGHGQYPVGPGPRKHTMAVTPDGVVLWLAASGRYAPGRLVGVHTSGAAPWDSFEGPAMPGQPRDKACVASASDGKSAFVAGLGKGEGAATALAAVYRVKLPERTAEVFFGDPAKPGSDETHLGAAGAQGLAVDGKGHLLISDTANNRLVVVDEKDGKFAGAIPVPSPSAVGADRSGGAVYVVSAGKGAAEVIKFGGWKDAKEQARIPLKVGGLGTVALAVDGGAKPPVVWASADGGAIYRIEDQGGKFGEPRRINEGKIGHGGFLDVTVDRIRREVYTRCGTGRTWWFRYSEEADKVEQVTIPERSGGGQGVNLVPAPDGNLYGLKWPMLFLKYDHNGKPLAWEQPDHRPFKTDGFAGKYPAHASFVPVSETEYPHTLGVRPSDGHLFVMEPATPGNRPPKMVREYLPTGKLVSEAPVVWKVSDGAIGPRFDAAGNIYIAEVVRPTDWPYPPEFDRAFPKKIELNKTRPSGAQDVTANMYGSIVKFGPKGGIVDFRIGSDLAGCMVPNPFKGEPKLDPALRKTDVAWYACTMLRGPEKLIGAEWVHPGISHVGMQACTCENVTFDVDEFGRVFFPDLNLFQVRVIDTNGNALAKFGGYGNGDSCGPESRDKTLATPEIAFSWLVGVGATDKYVYTGDSINRRMLRAKIVYAAEESCPIGP